MSDAVRTITEQVRARVLRDGVDLSQDAALAERYARDEIRRRSEGLLARGRLADVDEREAAREVVAALTGLGAIQPLLDDESVEEIWINGPTRVFVARNGVSELTSLVLTEQDVRDLVERMLRASGRRVDLSSPFVDASLPDGSRLHVAIPDVTRRHWAVNIRKFHRRVRDLHDLVASGSLTEQAAAFLDASVRAGLNILVSGPTHSGKTTMLGALLGCVRPAERIVTVEETFELDLAARDVVALQCRQPNLEGGGEISLRRLVKESLRMRPDRLVVGEVREAESLDLLIALNSGVPGMCTIHANSAADALLKLCTLPLLAGRNIDAAFVVPTVSSCIDLVVHTRLGADGARQVEEIAHPAGVDAAGRVAVEQVFARDGGRLRALPGAAPDRRKFEAAGIDLEATLRDVA
ncbi:CpaF family protein [Agromyces rhizosphaerae]|nr:ATPase, T2SS/T4P/T4SS family [Agromyces rhizosphaerae]